MNPHFTANPFDTFGYISNVLYCLVNHYSLLCIRSIYCIICFKPHLFSTTNLTTTESVAVHKISLKMFLIQILFLILLYRFLQYQNLWSGYCMHRLPGASLRLRMHIYLWIYLIHNVMNFFIIRGMCFK